MPSGLILMLKLSSDTLIPMVFFLNPDQKVLKNLVMASLRLFPGSMQGKQYENSAAFFKAS